MLSFAVCVCHVDFCEWCDFQGDSFSDIKDQILLFLKNSVDVNEKVQLEVFSHFEYREAFYRDFSKDHNHPLLIDQPIDYDKYKGGI